MSKTMLLIILAFSTGILYALTHTVNLDGSAQFTAVQSAINASATGDTVLVYPGRYLENINFNGHSLTLASLELTTGNPAYIDSTIIDGNQQSSCIYINSNESFVIIRGLLITNGIGYLFSNSILRYGGGIFCQLATEFSIINCNIIGNRADDGGGIHCTRSNITLKGTTIRNNSAANGGGGLLFNNNYLHPNSLIFDAQDKCSIYNNDASYGLDCQFNLYNSVHVILDTCTVISPLNYFITGYASDPHIENPITCEVEHAYMTEINHDLYVAPNGNNANDGLSEASPLRSIYYAMYHIAADSLNPKMIHLAPGNYSFPENYQQYGIPVKSWTTLTGETRETTVLDGSGTQILIRPATGSRNVTITNLTCRNSNISIAPDKSMNLLINNVIVENASSDIGSGIGITRCKDFRIKNTTARNNFASYVYPGFYFGENRGTNYLINCISENNTSLQGDGNGLKYTDKGTIIIDGCTFKGNFSSAEGMPTIFSIGRNTDDDTLKVIITNSNIIENTQTAYTFMALVSANNGIEISNCTFANNSGGSAVLGIVGDAVLKNNIFWNPGLTQEVQFLYSPDDPNNYDEYLSNNIIRNGMDGVFCDPSDFLHWQEGNIDEEPIFFGWGDNSYMITSLSSGIDAGTTDTTGLSLSPFDLFGNPRIMNGLGIQSRIDIGAYEYQGQIHAGFAVSDTSGAAPLAVHFTDMSIGDTDHWAWDFNGDGVLDSEEQNPTYVYTEGGTFSPSLIVSYANRYDSIRRMSIITPVANQDNTAAAREGLSIYPNPFQSSTTLSFHLKSPQKVKLEIFNIRGQKVKTLINTFLESGKHDLDWNGTDESNHQLASGIYFCSSYLGNKHRIQKLILVK